MSSCLACGILGGNRARSEHELKLRTNVSWEAAKAFRERLLELFAKRTPAELPRQLTDQILHEARRAAGGTIDDKLEEGARTTIEGRLASQLWQSKDAASQQRLAVWIVADVERLLRLDLSATGPARE